MLDTNAVSVLIQGQAGLTARVVAAPMAALCISTVTRGELMFGLAKRPQAKKLRLAVREFLARVDALPWDETAADRYGVLRADAERRGKSLGPLDLMIAAHALAVDAALVTNDKAFARVPGLQVENWAGD
jgi:tRNA(fMet)-specific endonuclease VapC